MLRAVASAVPAGNSPVGSSGASTDKAIARFSGTSGQTIQNSGLKIGDDSALIFPKVIDPGTAPGAGFAKLYFVAGTNVGTAKLIAYAGTSTTAMVIADNIGGGF